MGIGFQSFGGMLTGDNEPPAAEEVVETIAPVDLKELTQDQTETEKDQETEKTNKDLVLNP